MSQRFYKIKIGILLLLLSLVMVACSSSESGTNATREYTLYFLSAEEDRLVSVKYPVEETEKALLVDEIVAYMKGHLENYDYKPILSESLNLEQIILYDTTATLYFDKSYLDLEPTTEILVRAGIVKNLTQISGVEHISIQIDEQPLTNVDGTIVGAMTSKMFMDSAQNDFEDYEKIKLTLYYANEEMNQLVGVSEEVVYTSDMTFERLVVEELIKGTDEEGYYATINPDTKIINVTTKDGVCYVNLDSTFLMPATGINAELTVYSIVNSLVELSNINKVQISINGDTSYTYLEQIPLSTIFERNLEIVE